MSADFRIDVIRHRLLARFAFWAIQKRLMAKIVHYGRKSALTSHFIAGGDGVDENLYGKVCAAIVTHRHPL